MIPMLWKHMLIQYFKVLLLCISCFIAVLVTTRLEEIAHFATMGSEGFIVLLFIFYQIPYVVPIALPISALISAALLFQSLSQSQELTAMRACGLSLKEIMTPVIFASCLLAVGSFYIISELATSAHLNSALLKTELRAINPLLTLNSKHVMKLKGIYYDSMGASRQGESASQVVIAIPNKRNERLNVILAEKIQANSLHFMADRLCFISTLPSQHGEDQRDLLALENIQQSTTTTEDFAKTIQKKVWTLNNDHLKMSLLLVRLQEYQLALSQMHADQNSTANLKEWRQGRNQIISEIVRRLSLAFAVVSFTLMGASFGASISRMRSNRSLIYALTLTALFLAAYFSAISSTHQLPIALLLYFTPHLLIILLSVWELSRTARGVE